MSSKEGIFSLRIVIADFYMEKPISGLDACYSEFRSKEIKRVPVIRIFGANAQGQKTCMHVHGVFPYFYIPYDQKDFQSLNQAIYQMALNIDKAINISLSQGSSSAQHVFKVQLVKGIPFYGYHSSDHQFLKIYMFNPRFVRRAANLLQNGAILNKNFHPHESHVPYVLQFMIDYNLYGMSFLHVPLEILKFRSSDVIPFKNLQNVQILDPDLVKKISCSSLEVDIGSNFILNRFQLIAKTNTTNTNPGIESIWNDERLRRQNLVQSVQDDEEKLKAIPPLEIPSTQERTDVQTTESENFYRTSLISKLLAMETSMLESTQSSNQTLNSSNISNITIKPTNTINLNKQQRRTFNLSKILQNFVYPEECTQNDNIINASFIPNHLSNNSTFGQSLLANSNVKTFSSEKQSLIDDESICMEDTIVDEELVINLTQNHQHKTESQQQYVPLNATLREEDMELLDILQQLEENNEDKIDLDSSLAPLSQNHKNFTLTPQELDKEITATALQQSTVESVSDSEAESDDNVHDFSIALENLDDLILKLTQSQKEKLSPDHKGDKNVPQVDGADDLLKTPTKPVRILTNKSPPRTPTTPTNRRLNMTSPRRSPRTPKTGHKYAPLPLVSINRSTNKTTIACNSNGTTPLKGNDVDRYSLPIFSLRKNLALSELRRKSISLDTDVKLHLTPSGESKSLRRSKRFVDLYKTHITCSLSPRKTAEKMLKVYTVENQGKVIKESQRTQILLKTSAEEGPDYQFIKKNGLKIDLKIAAAEISQKVSSNSEMDEEAIESDNDNAVLCLKTRKTANLKRITRHSFVAKNSAKQRKTITANSIVNSSKFDYGIEDEYNKKNQFKLKKCKVKLRRIERAVQNESNYIENGKTDDQEKVNTKILKNLGKQKDGEKCSGRLQSGNEMVTEKEHLNNSISMAYTEKEQNISQDLLQSFSLDISSDLLGRESSDEEINETPPQEVGRSFVNAHLYNKSLSAQSPSVFSQNSSPSLLLPNAEVKTYKTPSSSHSSKSESCVTLLSSSNSSINSPAANIILTPLDLPPSREEVLKGCCKLKLPQYEFQQPFYSNPDDITKHKELGFTILQITGNKLNDLEEFQSVLATDVKGLTVWRREKLMRLGGVEMLNKYRNPQRVREYFSSQKSVTITPQFNAPTRQDVKLWLKAREFLKNNEDLEELMKTKNLDEDSPIKVRRQKVTMMLNAGDDNDGSDDIDNSLDCSSGSLLTLTPLTPTTPDTQQYKAKAQGFTPVTRNLEKTYLKNNMSLKQRNNCRVLRRVFLNKHLKESFKKESDEAAVIKDSRESAIAEPQPSETVKVNEESEILSSVNSQTSVTSEMVLAELEKSSFVLNLKESDDAMHTFSENCSVNNSFGFKVALENLQQAKADIEFNYLTIATLEVFVMTRADFYPNPELDEIRCLFYAIENSVPNECVDVGEQLPRKACGYIMVHDNRDVVAKEGRIHGIDMDIDVTIVKTEVEALEALLGMCSRWDPDIYAGYEIEMSSWGFVIERSKHLCLNIAPLLSRVPTQKVRDFIDEERESFTDLDVEMKLCGRILLDVWRLMRSEIALTSYTFENVMYHIMHKRCPWHSYRNLTEWFAAPCSRWIVIEYYLERVRGTLALLDQLDLIGRTSEMAKLIGIQFYEVLSRGSQFRVESMMLRIAKPKNLVPSSPSVQQRAHMRAPEYLPLIMEPQSRFYADPLIVLDFQSLYPSMIIAYNYCFSTCLGRVEHLGQSIPFEFGASQLRVSPAMLRKLIERDLITVSPCGVVFVKSAVREGILPRMLTEILDTRQMVKQSMKLHKSNSALQRILHSRQLGLKLMANVTYGYTAANFSGRMPAVEVGDSVVSKGRETLERAIKLVEDNDKWNVKVVYGDTDSMFVLVPGRSRDEAFQIGEEIAETVTKQNPHPVKLKLEKVYQPCILQTKKRYVGYMYESADQKEPVYEAKGIETVRRDGCPIVAKMLEKVLRILFETADASQVKHYVCRQFTKLLSGRANLQDLIFAKEFRGLHGYRPTACVPALEMTRKWIQTDPRRIPRRGERVPFIITNGPPGVPLIRLVHHPHEVLSNEGLKINAVYYITKAIIPPLNRCLLLIGADVNEWFANLPRKTLLTPALSNASEIISCPNPKSKKSTISQFFSTTNCITDCGRQTKQAICSQCSHNSSRSVIILQSKISKIERSYLTTQYICQACCGRVGDLRCGSLDCPVLYVLEGKRRDLQQIIHYRNLVEERF